MAAVEMNNFALMKMIIKRYKFYGCQYCLKRNFSNKKYGLNLLNEEIIGLERESFLSFRPWLNLIDAAWFRYKYDNSFDSGQSLTDTAKKVFLIVTEKLYNKDFDALSDTVNVNLLSKITTAVNRLTDQERSKLLDIKEKDISYYSYIYCGFRENIANPAIRYFDLLFVFKSTPDSEKVSKELNELTEKMYKGKRMIIISSGSASNDLKKIIQLLHRPYVTANLRLTKKIIPTMDEDWKISYLNFVFIEPTLPTAFR